MKRKSRMKIFVCSPLRGDVAANTALAKQLCLAVINEGHAPLAPHLHYVQFLNDMVDNERLAGISAGLAWLAQADQLWVFANDYD